MAKLDTNSSTPASSPKFAAPETLDVKFPSGWRRFQKESVAPGEVKKVSLAGEPQVLPAIVNGEPTIGIVAPINVTTVNSGADVGLSGTSVFSGKSAPSESLVRALNSNLPAAELLTALEQIFQRLEEQGAFFFGQRAITALRNKLADLRSHDVPAVAEYARRFAVKLRQLTGEAVSAKN